MHLPKARRRSALFLLALVIVSGIAEVVSIGAILPFLSLLSQFDDSGVPGWVSPWGEFLGLASAMELIIAVTALLAVAAILSAMIRVQLAKASQKFVFGASYDLGVRAFVKTIHQPYPYYISRNSSEIVADINKAQLLASGLFLPTVQAIGSAVIATFIIIGLVLVDADVAIAAGLGFALLYALVVVRSRKLLRRNSVVIAEAWAKRLKAVNEALGGIRDIALDETHDIFIQRFKAVEHSLASAQSESSYRAAAPRFVVEGVGIVVLAVIASALTLSDRGFAGTLPVLGVLALGAQRLLPLIQSIYAGWAASSSCRRMLSDFVAALSLPDPPQEATVKPWPAPALQSGIALVDVDFAYPESNKLVIEQASIFIRPGDRLGIVGASGSGKTTLMDLLLGLYLPTSGYIQVDGVTLEKANLPAWRSKVAHVPQHIFLSDASIGENIAFGIASEKIDWNRVRDAAARASLLPLIESLPDGFRSEIGEHGAKLSGGQRQRIGIARALYKSATLLVLDEATSALDYATEAEVNEAIRALDRELTIVVISHRASSVKICERWLWIDRGEISEVDRQSMLEKVEGRVA